MAIQFPKSSFAFRIIPKEFFFDRARVLASESRATLRFLGRAGAFVRQTAQRSMRKARRARLSELTPEQRQSYRIRQAIARRSGAPRPLLPFVGSKPGEPPRVRQGDLKRHIYYAYEGDKRSVLIGPLGFRRSNVPALLEYGGQAERSDGTKYTMAKRPYMAPALEAARPRMPGWWQQAFSNARAG